MSAGPKRVTSYGSSWLITPASTPGRFDTAANSGADVALLDLEDSVAPGGKDAARVAAVDWLTHAKKTIEAPIVGVRLNAPATVHGLKDLLALAGSGLRPDVLLVPKVESARDIDLVATVTDAGTGDGQRHVWALIETPQAIQHLPEILISRALAGLVFGTADYAAAAGCGRSSRALWYPRATLAAGAAAAGLPAIDSPYFDLEDGDGLRRESEEAAELGFAGKFAIHPRQLPTIRAAFRPSTQDVAHAHAVITAVASAPGGITTVGGQMVGPPMVTAARAVAARADHDSHIPSIPGA